MITIIKHGEKREDCIECPECGCIFMYGLEDRTYDSLGFSYVTCPDCDRRLLTSLGKWRQLNEK